MVTTFTRHLIDNTFGENSNKKHRKMFQILERLEDVDNPLLGPTLYGLQCSGLLQKKRFSAMIFNCIHILAFLFVVSQYIELWIIRENLEMAMKNLSVTMLSTVCVYKSFTFVFWQKRWTELINFIAEQEKRQLSKKDYLTNVLISKYKRYSRRVTYFYWCLVIATLFAVVLTPLISYCTSDLNHREMMRNGSIPYPEMLSAWLPFDRTRGIGYWVSCLEHSLILAYGASIVATFDSVCVVIMTFFAGQLKILSLDCARLFGEGNEVINSEEVAERIKECHYHHLYLTRFSTIFNSLLSPVMFVYIIICSLMICASAIQLTMKGTSNMQRIWIAEYVLALIAQLFLYCWHSNEVLYMSNRVDEGVYQSNWWSQNVKVRRNVLLLGGQLRKSIVFTAGPFTNLNVATFVAILKGSYSFFTLLNQTDE